MVVGGREDARGLELERNHNHRTTKGERSEKVSLGFFFQVFIYIEGYLSNFMFKQGFRKSP